MRIEKFTDGWLVYLEPGDLPRTPGSGVLGSIGRLGGLRLMLRPRMQRERDLARLLLERAREELWERGELKDVEQERARREEARRGSFVARLNDGRERRFNGLRGAEHLRGARARPGALDWIEAAFKEEERARYGEVFREMPPRIYTEPLRVFASGGYGAMTVGTHAHFPIAYLMKNEHGRVSTHMPPRVLRAYELKAETMKLVDSRALDGRELGPAPGEIADAWAVTGDAFEEAGVAFQAAYAAENAAYWRKRASVSSRRSANRANRQASRANRQVSQSRRRA